MKKLLTLLLLIFMFTPTVLADGSTIVTYVIDPEKNAYNHNNKGVMYVEEKCYYAAIQEFKIAISLNPKTQATSVYFNNLGKVYMIIGYPELAVDCFKNALTQYSLNFEYYENLAKCYAKLGKVNEQLAIYSKNIDKNPTSKIMAALLEEQLGNKKKAVIYLDEFASSEPDLIISSAVKNHIKKLVNELNNKDKAL